MGKKTKHFNLLTNRQHQASLWRAEERNAARKNTSGFVERHGSPINRTPTRKKSTIRKKSTSAIIKDALHFNMRDGLTLAMFLTIAMMAGKAAGSVIAPPATGGSALTSQRRRGDRGSHLVPLIGQEQGSVKAGSGRVVNNGNRQVSKEREDKLEDNQAKTYERVAKTWSKETRHLIDEQINEFRDLTESAKNDFLQIIDATDQSNFKTTYQENPDLIKDAVNKKHEQVFNQAENEYKNSLTEVLGTEVDQLLLGSIRNDIVTNVEQKLFWIEEQLAAEFFDEEMEPAIKIHKEFETFLASVDNANLKREAIQVVADMIKSIKNQKNQYIIEMLKLKEEHLSEAYKYDKNKMMRCIEAAFNNYKNKIIGMQKREIMDVANNVLNSVKERELQERELQERDLKLTTLCEEEYVATVNQINAKIMITPKILEFDPETLELREKPVAPAKRVKKTSKINPTAIAKDSSHPLKVDDATREQPFIMPMATVPTLDEAYKTATRENQIEENFNQAINRLTAEGREMVLDDLEKYSAAARILALKLFDEVSMDESNIKDAYKNNKKSLSQYIFASHTNYANKLKTRHKKMVIEKVSRREIPKSGGIIYANEYEELQKQIYAEVLVHPKELIDEKLVKETQKESIEEKSSASVKEVNEQAKLDIKFNELMATLPEKTRLEVNTYLEGIDKIIDKEKSNVIQNFWSKRDELLGRDIIKEKYKYNYDEFTHYISGKFNEFKKKMKNHNKNFWVWSGSTKENMPQGKVQRIYNEEFAIVLTNICTELMVYPREFKIDPTTGRVIELDPVTGHIIESDLILKEDSSINALDIMTTIFILGCVSASTYLIWRQRFQFFQTNSNTRAKQTTEKPIVQPKNEKETREKSSVKKTGTTATTTTTTITTKTSNLVEERKKYEELERERIKKELTKEINRLNEKKSKIQKDHLGIEKQLRDRVEDEINNPNCPEGSVERSVSSLKRLKDSDPFHRFDAEIKIIDDKIKMCETELTENKLNQCKISLTEADAVIANYEKEMENRHKAINGYLGKLAGRAVNLATLQNDNQQGESSISLDDVKSAAEEMAEAKKGETTARENSAAQSEGKKEATKLLPPKQPHYGRKARRGQPIAPPATKYIKPPHENAALAPSQCRGTFFNSGHQKITTFRETLSSKIDNLFKLITDYFDKFFPKEEDYNKPSLARMIGRGTFFNFIIKLCECCNKHMPNETIANLRGLICHDHRQLFDDNAVYDFITLFKNEYEKRAGKKQGVVMRCSEAILTTIEQLEFIMNAVNAYGEKRQLQRQRFYQRGEKEERTTTVADFVTPRMNVMKDIEDLMDLYQEKIMPFIILKGNLIGALEHITVVDPTIYYTCEFMLQSIHECLTNIGFQVDEGYLKSLRNCFGHALGALEIGPMHDFLSTVLPCLIQFLREQGIELDTANINNFMDVQELKSSSLML